MVKENIKQGKMKKIGNSHYCLLPKIWLDNFNITENEEVFIDKCVYGFAIIPKKNKPDYLKLKSDFHENLKKYEKLKKEFDRLLAENKELRAEIKELKTNPVQPVQGDK